MVKGVLPRLESLVQKEFFLTNLKDWRRRGIILSENNSFAFIYEELGGKEICYLPLSQGEVSFLQNKDFYIEFKKERIVRYKDETSDLDFTTDAISLFRKYSVYLLQYK